MNEIIFQIRIILNTAGILIHANARRIDVRRSKFSRQIF